MTQAQDIARHVRQRNNLARLAELTRPVDAPLSCMRPRSPKHRATDWRLESDAPWVCGLCHPPAVADVERRV